MRLQMRSLTTSLVAEDIHLCLLKGVDAVPPPGFKGELAHQASSVNCKHVWAMHSSTTDSCQVG